MKKDDFPQDDIGEILGDVNVADGDTGADDIAHLLDEPDYHDAVGEEEQSDELDDFPDLMDDDFPDINEPEMPQEETKPTGQAETGDDDSDEPERAPEAINDNDDSYEEGDLFQDDSPDVDSDESTLTTPGEEWDRSTSSDLVDVSDLMDENGEISIDDLGGDMDDFISPKDAEVGDPEPLFSDKDGKSIIKIDYSQNLTDDDFSLDGDLLESEIPDEQYRIGILNTENTSKPLSDAVREEREERNSSLGDTIPPEKVPGKPYVPVITPESRIRELSNDRYASKELSHSASHRSWVSSLTLAALFLSLFTIILGLIFYFINSNDEVTYEVNSNSMELSSVTYTTHDGDVSSNEELAPFSTTVKVPVDEVASISAVSRNIAGEPPMISCTITRNGESTTSVGVGGVTCNL